MTMNTKNKTEYVPYQLSDHVFERFKSGRVQKRSAAELWYITSIVESLISDFYLPESDLTYTNILYPHDVAKILSMSKTDKWPSNYDVDEIIEYIITKWIKKTVINPTEYLNKLWSAIKDTECEIGMMTRLNIDAISKVNIEKVMIITKRGTIVQEQINKKPTLTNEAKTYIKQLLNDQFINNIDILYNRIKSLHNSYTIEQTLLSWIGYIAVRTIISTASAPIAFNNRLLIQQ